MTDERRGKRALFSPGAGRRVIPGAGRRAVFGEGPVELTCRSCHAVVAVDARRAIALAAGRPWIPGRAHRIRCPACGRRAWVRMRRLRRPHG